MKELLIAVLAIVSLSASAYDWETGYQRQHDQRELEDRLESQERRIQQIQQHQYQEDRYYGRDFNEININRPYNALSGDPAYELGRSAGILIGR